MGDIYVTHLGMIGVRQCCKTRSYASRIQSGKANELFLETLLRNADVSDTWQEFARYLLQDAVAQRELNSREFSELLSSIGVEIAPKALSRRINRGTFDAGFFLMCLAALGMTKLEIQGERLGDVVLVPDRAWKKNAGTGSWGGP